jgi:uncharacterized protein with ParB-like and HNH nuclease domain
MEAKARAFTFLGDEGAVRIPFFQRGYVWKKENWEDLLFDIIEFDKSHFLGSLILKQQKIKSGEPKDVLVIDGQQRLTTLSVLVKVLYDLFDKNLQDNCRNEILKYLYYKKNATDEKHEVKIIHSRVDTFYYKQIMGEVEKDKITQLTLQEINEINDDSNRILQCYKYFSEELIKKTSEIRKKLFNHILNQENKIIVLIDLTDQDNEQVIFDTINSAGVRLSGTDIVKNALFQRAMELYDRDEVINLYEKYWDSIFSKDEELINYWNAQKSTGRLMRDNSEILLQAIAVIKNIFDPDKHTLSELPDLYKEIIGSLDSSELKIFINEIYDYAKIYKDYIVEFENSTLFNFEDNLKRLLHILKTLDISTFHPYILFLLKKYNDENDISLRLKYLEALIIKRMILNQETKSYNKLCKDFITDENIVFNKAQAINDDEIMRNIEYITNKNATILLFWIELYRRHNDTKQSVKELKYNYSLEHIMPQKWEEYWSNVSFYDETNNIIVDQEQGKAARHKKIYYLGNMTLLNSRLNTSLRNYEFKRKIEGEGRKKGMRHYSDLFITKIDIISEYDNGNIIWDERSIINRTNKLGEEILRIWKI